MFGKKVLNEISVDQKHINKYIDFTNLDPTLTKKNLEKFICVAYKNKYRAICVLPVYLDFCKKYIDYKFKNSLKLCTVIGFPLGANSTASKVYEVKDALKNGANELDVVAPLYLIKNGDFAKVKQELQKIVKSAKRRPVKIIIETSILTKQELERVCSICLKCKVSAIQTNTGCFDGGATPEDVETIFNITKNRCNIKASGGIETKPQAVNLLRLGATIIGTSREL